MSKYGDSFKHKHIDHTDRILKYSDFNIEINDKNKALEALKLYSDENIIYQNMYTNLYDKTNNKFYAPIKIETLISMYFIRLNIESVLLKYILIVESYLKESVSFIIGKNFGVNTVHTTPSIDEPNDYLNKKNYSKKVVARDGILRKLKDVTYNPGNRYSNILKYKSESNLPPWILANEIEFKKLIDWYYILDINDKNYVISSIFKTRILLDKELNNFMINSLRLFNEIRNKCAHIVTNYTFDSNYKSTSFNFLSKNINNLSKPEYSLFMKEPLSIGILSIYLFLDVETGMRFLMEIITIFESELVKSISNNHVDLTNAFGVNGIYNKLVEIFTYSSYTDDIKRIY